MTKPLSEQVKFTQEGAGAVERLASDKLKEWVSVKDFGVIGDGSDESVKVQAALDSGASVVYFPNPATYYNFGDININTRGQSLVGESWRTCGVVPRGTNCFNVRENGVEITGFWFRPATVITGQQDTANTTNLVRIRNLAGEDLGIDGLRFHDNYCQNIAGAAILLKSPLRESHIYKNQFRGMGSVASSLGVIHTDMNATFTDSTNYVYIYENVFYRAEKPFIYCKAVAGSNPANRYHDNWYIQNNLFHGQLLDESVAVADPNGPVVGGNTHMLLMRSVDNFVIENNTFTSFNGDYSAVYVDALTTDDKNGPVYVRNNRVFVDNNGTYTGTAIVLSDCFTSEAVGNTFTAGFQTNQISVINTGTFTYTPVVEVRNNRSQNQFAVAVSLPSTYTTSDGIIRTLTATTVNTERTAISDRINYKRAGRTTLSDGATTAAITWAGLGMPNMPNGNYDVYMRVVDQNLASWASATNSSGFTINLASNPGTRAVSWFVIDSTGF